MVYGRACLQGLFLFPPLFCFLPLPLHLCKHTAVELNSRASLPPQSCFVLFLHEAASLQMLELLMGDLCLQRQHNNSSEQHDKNMLRTGDGERFTHPRRGVRTASKLASHMRPRFKIDTMVFDADANSPSPAWTGYTSLPGTHLGWEKKERRE